MITLTNNPIQIQDTDIIVNSTNRELAWEETTINGDILREAGPELMKEFNLKGSLEVAELFITKGFNCKCNHIIHVVSPWYKMGNEYQILEKLYHDIFNTAYLFGNSISLPSLGTGTFMIPKENAFYILQNVLLTNTNIKYYSEIRFCITDDENFKLYSKII